MTHLYGLRHSDHISDALINQSVDFYSVTDLCSVSVELPSASKNISVPGLAHSLTSSSIGLSLNLLPTLSGSWSDFILKIHD